MPLMSPPPAAAVSAAVGPDPVIALGEDATHANPDDDSGGDTGQPFTLHGAPLHHHQPFSSAESFGHFRSASGVTMDTVHTQATGTTAGPAAGDVVDAGVIVSLRVRFHRPQVALRCSGERSGILMAPQAARLLLRRRPRTRQADANASTGHGGARAPLPPQPRQRRRGSVGSAGHRRMPSAGSTGMGANASPGLDAYVHEARQVAVVVALLRGRLGIGVCVGCRRCLTCVGRVCVANGACTGHTGTSCSRRSSCGWCVWRPSLPQRTWTCERVCVGCLAPGSRDARVTAPLATHAPHRHQWEAATRCCRRWKRPTAQRPTLRSSPVTGGC